MALNRFNQANDINSKGNGVLIPFDHKILLWTDPDLCQQDSLHHYQDPAGQRQDLSVGLNLTYLLDHILKKLVALDEYSLKLRQTDL